MTASNPCNAITFPNTGIGRSEERDEDSFLPSGLPSSSPEEALDCACGLYLNDPSAWAAPSTNYAAPR